MPAESCTEDSLVTVGCNRGLEVFAALIRWQKGDGKKGTVKRRRTYFLLTI
jgi:hypothetical protein